MSVMIDLAMEVQNAQQVNFHQIFTECTLSQLTMSSFQSAEQIKNAPDCYDLTRLFTIKCKLKYIRM